MSIGRYRGMIFIDLECGSGIGGFKAGSICNRERENSVKKTKLKSSKIKTAFKVAGTVGLAVIGAKAGRAFFAPTITRTKAAVQLGKAATSGAAKLGKVAKTAVTKGPKAIRRAVTGTGAGNSVHRGMSLRGKLKFRKLKRFSV